MKPGACAIVFLIAVAPLTHAREIQCGAGASELPNSSTFVGYTRPGETVVRAAALVTQGSIAAYDGRHLAEGNVLHAVLPGTTTSVEVADVHAYLNQLGPDHCVYEATLTASAGADWQLWTPGRMDDAFRAPSDEEAERLQKYRPRCIRQGDFPEDKQPPCAQAKLLAVSDLDGDGDLEFWHSAPYTWDTGLSVIEESEQEPELLVSACPGCSD